MTSILRSAEKSKSRTFRYPVPGDEEGGLRLRRVGRQPAAHPHRRPSGKEAGKGEGDEKGEEEGAERHPPLGKAKAGNHRPFLETGEGGGFV